MKLKCPYCKEEIKEEEICPHCNRNLNKPFFFSLLISIICFLAGMFIFSTLVNCGKSCILITGFCASLLCLPLFFISIISFVIFVYHFIKFKLYQKKKKEIIL